MNVSKSDLNQRSMPYLRPSLPDVEPDVVLRGRDAPVLKDLGNGLLVAYVMDVGDHLQYIQYRHLQDSGANESELHSHAVHNLTVLAKKLRIEPHGKMFAVFLEGNFEASLILIGGLWDGSLARTVTAGFVAAIPARDILVFCDLASVEGITQLRQVVARANEGGDHLLTAVLYRRQGQEWVQYEG
jgi:uncharacterized protein YtpQ (UPF0354 family)